MSRRFHWGHININVRNLDVSVDFYGKLGFERFLPGIPYLNLSAGRENLLAEEAAEALGIPAGSRARGCILQLDRGFPKIDLIEFSALDQREPTTSLDRGLVRLCLASRDLAEDYEYLKDQGVVFLTPPRICHDRMADIAICSDPDGTLIELIQIHPDRWPG